MESVANVVVLDGVMERVHNSGTGDTPMMTMADLGTRGEVRAGGLGCLLALRRERST